MIETKKKPMPQRYRVLLLAADTVHDGFTRADAAKEAGCYELASRIGELEAEGVVFGRTRERVQTRYGGNTTVVRYRLRTVPKAVVERVREWA